MLGLLGGRLERPVALVGVLAVAAFLVLPAGGAAQTVAATVAFALPPAVLGLRVRSLRGAAHPRLRLLLGASTTYGLAMGAWYLALAVGHPIAFPSGLDLVFFAVFSCYITFLALVLRDSSPTGALESRLALVDSMILTTAACAVIWVALIQPALPGDASVFATIATLAYPGFALAMVMVAVRLLVASGTLFSRSGLLLMLWVGAEACGDIVYGRQMTTGDFDYASAVTASWLLGCVALATLVARQDPSQVRSVAPRRPVRHGRLWTSMRQVIPLAAALVPFALALLDPDHAGAMVVGGLVSFSLVTWRAGMLQGDLKDERQLTAQLDRAVDELAAQRDELEHLAFSDPLTGLANRARFTEDLEAALTSASRGPGTAAGPTVGVLMLDLDDFKVVNDSLGHGSGDALLIAVAGRLEAVVAGRGTVARLGGDEFGVLLPGATTESGVAVARRVVDALAQPFGLEGRVLHTAASVGVAVVGPGGDVQAVMRDADLAMYAAKAVSSGTVRVFEAPLLERAQARLELESHLRGAVARSELVVEYQPILDLRTGEVASMEALVRWHHPAWGVVPPDRFIPAAESTGTIVGIGEWVLRRACYDAVSVNRDRVRPLSVTVNVSVRQAQDAGFAQTVQRALTDSGLPPGRLVLEVTESLVMDSSPTAAATIAELQRLGVRLSIDDFGAGHSSLARVRALPVRELKIDGELVRQLSDAASSRPIVTAIIAMGRALDLAVIAEGVEEEDQLDALRELGCDMVQGYLLARPAPLAAIARDRRLPPLAVLDVEGTAIQRLG
ncbi:putative bifunctional diguanylate cyclase/phosphodiesterase [Cellulomonas soli]|nr:bifunctional diguanylate cyclase/phosphodiesterase [Cellulomonas soli]NYI58415.1 diguanylate cyclase (GGDEF)-like protein [Cellulomonas soli]